jgi:thiamine biosynthesis lipoprotein
MAASVWVPNSLISKFNNSSDSVFTVPKQTNSYFLDNFNLCKEVYHNTGGAYNPTVGELVNAWGFGFKNRENMDSAIVDSLLQSVGFSDTQMHTYDVNDSTFIVKTNANTQLDYNGIAQGYSVDVLGDYFKSKGIFHFMIEVGGELLANGRKGDGSFWKIGVDKPLNKNRERNLAATLQLDNKAVATSGNYRKFYEKDGVRYAHTLNPQTGFPVQHSLLSVTVVMDNCGLADAYATSFMVLGFEKSKALLTAHPEWGIEA